MSLMMVKPDFRYYLITDRKLCSPKPLPKVVEEACRAGIRAVQLREKDLADYQFFDLATQIRRITARYKTQLFINGRPDIAQAVGADGVQCREDGLGPAEMDHYWPELMVGASVHSLDSARKAQWEGADFLLFGPVFFTASKAKYGDPQGLKKLERIISKTTLPVFAVGGITPDRITACMQAGAYGTAGISAVMNADDISATVQKIREKAKPVYEDEQ